jgi:hypothetical protein
MQALLELQLAMREGLAGRDAGVAASIDRPERLDIYRNTVIGALTRALRLVFPAVHRLGGAEFFEGAARVFIEGHLPTSAWLDDYGAEFPAFLGELEQARSVAYLRDVARLEWSVNCVLHAEDLAPLEAGELVRLSDAERARVRFAPNPAVALLHSDYPVDRIWRAVLEENDAALSSIDPSAGPVWLLIERTDAGTEARSLERHAWEFTAALFSGWPLHRLVEGERGFEAALLAEHLARGRFAGYSLADS